MSGTNQGAEKIAFRLLAAIARCVCSTLRVRRVNAEAVDALRSGKQNVVFAFWHGSMMLGWFAHAPHRQETVSALVSQSKDGAILAAVLEHWGFTLIRGSSRTGGKEALHSMVEAAAAGSSLCVTPDGPTGPRHIMKPGALLAAQRAGVPLVIVGIAAARKKVFIRSWDRFEIPLPFSRVCLWYDSPISFPADAAGGENREAVAELLASLQRRLDEAHKNAHDALGINEI
jgi:lysophospholipid acyltransferase (LPLAT)-like uncharacterized protein